ncbi:hypothetical protein MP638_003700 [Amoeboaphelidium occidentale]|nr:hypothetical protein MP638_003700 [Amoeboaphelidium occidentale]
MISAISTIAMLLLSSNAMPMLDNLDAIAGIHKASFNPDARLVSKQWDEAFGRAHPQKLESSKVFLNIRRKCNKATALAMQDFINSEEPVYFIKSDTHETLSRDGCVEAITSGCKIMNGLNRQMHLVFYYSEAEMEGIPALNDMAQSCNLKVSVTVETFAIAFQKKSWHQFAQNINSINLMGSDEEFDVDSSRLPQFPSLKRVHVNFDAISGREGKGLLLSLSSSSVKELLVTQRHEDLDNQEPWIAEFVAQLLVTQRYEDLDNQEPWIAEFVARCPTLKKLDIQNGPFWNKFGTSKGFAIPSTYPDISEAIIDALPASLKSLSVGLVSVEGSFFKKLTTLENLKSLKFVAKNMPEFELPASMEHLEIKWSPGKSNVDYYKNILTSISTSSLKFFGLSMNYGVPIGILLQSLPATLGVLKLEGIQLKQFTRDKGFIQIDSKLKHVKVQHVDADSRGLADFLISLPPSTKSIVMTDVALVQGGRSAPMIPKFQNQVQLKKMSLEFKKVDPNAFKIAKDIVNNFQLSSRGRILETNVDEFAVFKATSSRLSRRT